MASARRGHIAGVGQCGLAKFSPDSLEAQISIELVMPMGNIEDAKANISRLVEILESGAEAEIIICRNGKPLARLVPFAPRQVGNRIGVAKGRCDTPAPDPGVEAAAAELCYRPER
jgi:antitoxin (DNA-binding transcriptional repressor) of toxin-antitoxin stability system